MVTITSLLADSDRIRFHADVQEKVYELDEYPVKLVAELMHLQVTYSHSMKELFGHPSVRQHCITL